MLVAALFSSVIVGLLRGGDLRHIAELNPRGLWFYLLALLLQVLVNCEGFPYYRGLAYSLSFALLILGSLLDRRIQGMSWVSLGLLLNSIVIMINGGKMPVKLSQSRFPSDAQVTTHFPMTDSTLGWFLGDIFPLPLFGRHSLYLSPGDLLIGLGAFLAVQRLMLSESQKAQQNQTGR